MTREPVSRNGLLSRRAALASLGAAIAGSTISSSSSAQTRVLGRHLEGPQPITVSARPLGGFERGNSRKTKFGKLEFRGGLVLSSDVQAFGGWSGIAVDDDGRKFLAVSDEGTWMSGELTYQDGRPSQMVNTRIGPIVGLGSRPLDRKRDLDSESITLLDGTVSRGTVLIGFERNHRVGRFPVDGNGIGPPLGYLKSPAEVRKTRSNRGFEAVGVIRGGSLKGSVIAFAEELHDQARNHTGWIWAGGIGGEPQRVGLVNIDDFAVTDVASLSDGSLVILERKFRWTEGVRMRLRLVPAAIVKPGVTLDGEVLLEADMLSEIDNMEALAVTRDSRGGYLLTLMSDDNYNHFLQRTLLMQFSLADPSRRV